jgi:hypothetical protein
LLNNHHFFIDQKQSAEVLRIPSQAIHYPENQSRMQALVVDVSGTVGKEYVPLAEDLVRTLVIQLLVQMLVAAVDDSTSFFSAQFFIVLIYVLLGVAAYHLLAKRLLVFA